MNTYGLHSINKDTFNLKCNNDYTYPQPARDALVTFFKVHNLTLNALGYISGISGISGCVRIGTGLITCTITLLIGERDAPQGAIIGHWYDEALVTGITQIARGVLEAFVPFGWIANGALDTLTTLHKFGKKLFVTSVCTECAESTHHRPYPDPRYSFPFWLLYLA